MESLSRAFQRLVLVGLLFPVISAQAQTQDIPLFRKFPSLKKNIPWIQILNHYTPLEPLRGLEKNLYSEFGYDSPLDARLWVKRDDDQTGVLGGNKARKLEFLIADAKKQGAKILATSGMYGSNHALAVSLAAKMFGFQTELALGPQPITDNVHEKLLAYYALGAKMTYAGNKISLGIEILKQGISSWFNHEYYMIGPGGSSDLGDLGYVNAFLELQDQVGDKEMPEEIYVPVGTMGTAAGLIVGNCLAGTWKKVKIVGVEVSEPPLTSESETINQAMHLYDFIRVHMSAEDRARVPDCRFIYGKSFQYLTNYLAPGYGGATPAVTDTVSLLASTDQIVLEPTYSGKTMLALIDHWRATFRKDHFPKKTLFWLTYRAHDLDAIINSVHWTDPNAKYKDLPKDFQQLF